MNKSLYIVPVLLVTGLSYAKAQKASTMKKDFDVTSLNDSVNIVVIKTNDIPVALNKALSPDTKQGIKYPTTIYTNPDNEVHVVHVNNQKGNNTYVFQKTSEVILMLHPAKVKTEKPVSLATK